jgi:hypothetical protein
MPTRILLRVERAKYSALQSDDTSKVYLPHFPIPVAHSITLLYVTAGTDSVMLFVNIHIELRRSLNVG